MEVQITPEQEVQLTQIATQAGTNTEQLVKDAVLRLLEAVTRPHGLAEELPVLHLGPMQSLHRRDLYDDVR